MATPEDPQDGFDLLEYPCEFMFKAMCHAQDDLPAVDSVVAAVTQTVAADALLSTKIKPSRTGKFEAVSVSVTITSRDQLETIYTDIANLTIVVMTL